MKSVRFTALRFAAALLCLLPSLAFAQDALPPPPQQPPALVDVGGRASCPKIIVGSGQSNKAGFDTGGDKTVQPGILITNSVSTTNTATALAPTALVPAAFGSSPLNQGLTGVVSTAAAAYNNSEVQLANRLAIAGFAPIVQSPTDATIKAASVIEANWFPGQSISQWVGTTPGVMDANSPYWQHLLSGLSLIQQKFPGCYITQFDWDQGESDSWTTNTGYNSLATYQQGLSTLITAIKGLTVNGQAMWNSDPSKGRLSKITLQQLATWPSNYSANARNDVIDTYRGGARDGAVDVIPVDGLTESTQNPGPHFDGASLVALGSRLFDSYLHTRVGGSYGDQANAQTQYGSADAFPNRLDGPTAASGTGSVTSASTTLTMTAVTGTIQPGMAIYAPATINGYVRVLPYGTNGTTGTGGTGTYALAKSPGADLSGTITFGQGYGIQDLRTGATIYANGAPIILPNFLGLANRPVELEVFGNVATVLDTSQLGGSSLYNEVNGQQSGTITVQPNQRWRFRVVSGVWHAWMEWPNQGRATRTPQNSYTAGVSATIGYREYFSNRLTSGNAITISPTPGASYIFREAANGAGSTLSILAANDSAGARIIEPDGTLRQTSVAGGYPIAPGATVLAEVDSGSNVNIITDSGRVGGVFGVTLSKLATTPTTAPGAGKTRIFALAGTNTGTCKLMVQAGTSTTATLLLDNVGSGC